MTREVVVLNTLTGAADVIHSLGNLSVTGQAILINLRSPNLSYVKKAYTAGTAQVLTVTIDAGTGVIQDNKVYQLVMNKSQNFVQTPDGLNLMNPNPSYNGIEQYGVTSGTGATATTVATLFETAINAAITNGSTVITSVSRSTNVLTITMSTPSVTCTIDDPQNCTSSIVNTTPPVVASYTAAQINALSPAPVTAATTGHNYAQYTFIHMKEMDNHDLHSTGKMFGDFQTDIFVDEAATNFAAFNTALIAVPAGTATASKYLGFTA